MQSFPRNPSWLVVALALAIGGCDDKDRHTDKRGAADDGDDRGDDDGKDDHGGTTGDERGADGDGDGDGDGGKDQPDDLPPDGYTLRLFAQGLNFPTAVAFATEAGDDRIWVSEAGIDGNPQIVEVDSVGVVTPLLVGDDLGQGMFLPPLTDVTYYNGQLLIAHRQMGENGWMVGAISVLDPDDPSGSFRTVLTDLPATGDHTIGDVVAGDDGLLYFTIGSATNSSVVGPDNELLTGWLAMAPDFHEFPARDILLSGVEYQTGNILTEGNGDIAITAPYMPFNSGEVDAGMLVRAPQPDARIEGMIAGNAAIYSVSGALDMDMDNDGMLDGLESSLSLVAWGLRNPFGLLYNEGQLYITNNGADIRGVTGETNGELDLQVVEPRPIANDYDDLFVLDLARTQEEDFTGAFYGFPDFFHDRSNQPLPVTDAMFCEPQYSDIEIPCPEFALDPVTHAKYQVDPSVAQFELHSSANKLDMSMSERFGHMGDLFVAQTGSFVPITGATEFVGYKVVVVDGETYEVQDFIAAGSTQEEIFDPEGFNKPIDVKFDGDAMYIVDFGVFEPGIGLQEPNTGKLWIVTALAEQDDEQDDDHDDDDDKDDDGH